MDGRQMRLKAGVCLLAVFFWLAGCQPTAQLQVMETMRWPAPPEIARVSLLKQVRQGEDMGIRRGVFSRLWQELLGQQQPEIVAPHGLTTDHQGRLYVVDKGLRQVLVFDPQQQSLLVIPRNGPLLVTPIDVAVEERRGRIFVSDAGTSAVRIFTVQGEPAGEIDGGLIGRPTGMAINTVTDELLVVDAEHGVLLRFDLATLQPQKMTGKQGQLGGLFNAPTAVAAGPEGNIYVVDTLNHRIQIFDAGGEFIRAFGEAGDVPGYFERPKAIAVDSQGNLHVVDALFDNVQVFNTEGQLLMDYGGTGTGPGEFWLPSGICIDAQDRIYVADTYNKRVQIFQFLKNGELPE
ncbi:MAG: 6-bladed beta-propeller [Desulfoarculaceae bacterium]|nr:6-bladed beta-propeller [Desulfoarculaceae bacterium]